MLKKLQYKIIGNEPIIPTPLLKKEKNRQYYYFENDIDIFEKY